MADVKISQLPAASVVNTNDILVLNQGGTTKTASKALVVAGLATSSELAGYATTAQIAGLTNTAQVAAITTQQLSAISINAGTGLTGGGTLAANSTIAIAALSPNPTGTYGSSTQIPVLTVNQIGQITGVTTQAVSGGGSATPTDVQVFTSSGTWTKPAGAKSVQVTIVGAGGGGGSGRKTASGQSGAGGGAGAGGGFAIRTLDAAILSATETVTIGAAGIGGASVATNSTNGNAGTAGGITSFNTWVFAGGGGAAGVATTASGPAGTNTTQRAMFAG